MHTTTTSMASTMNSSPVTNSTRPQVSTKTKKKKKCQIEQIQSQFRNQSEIKWKSEVQQQLYSSKLLHALQNIQPSTTPDSRPGKIVREAADRVLAATAKGKTRWSRAILKNRLKLKFTKRQRVAVTGSSRSSKKSNVSISKMKSKNLQAVQRKGRVLGRLVPGCKKQSLPVVLDEATDYIAALEMQVRAMAALADLLSGSSSGQPSPNC